jgi:hypothetical protein
LIVNVAPIGSPEAQHGQEDGDRERGKAGTAQQEPDYYCKDAIRTLPAFAISGIWSLAQSPLRLNTTLACGLRLASISAQFQLHTRWPLST